MDVASLQTYMADIDNLALVASIDNMRGHWESAWIYITWTYKLISVNIGL